MPTRPAAPPLASSTCRAPTSAPSRRRKDIPADALILDLEDAVAPDAKPEARERVCAAVTGGGYGSREIAIRANGIGTPWHDDDLDGHRRRRARTPSSSRRSTPPPRCTRSSRRSRPAARPTTRRIWAMLETPVAMLARRRRSPARSERLDRARDGHQRPRQGAAGRPRARPPAAAAGPRAVPARRPRRRQGDPRRRLQRHQGRGRLPGRVPAGPRAGLRRQDADPPEPGRARATPPSPRPPTRSSWPAAIIAAFEEAEAEGRGVVTVDGRMVENLHVEEARRILAISEAIAARSA